MESNENEVIDNASPIGEDKPNEEATLSRTDSVSKVDDDNTPNSNQNQASQKKSEEPQEPPPPTGKRVRFSICEYITETLVLENWGNGSHENPAFESDNAMGNGKPEEGRRGRYIGGKLRRDSVHPLVPFHPGKEKDPSWDVCSPSEDYEKEEASGEPWGELSTKQKILRVLTALGKFVGLFVLLYFFVCSLDILSLGFRLVGGRTAGDIFRQSSILQNPVVGVMIGILTTVLVQSSSTSTSIIVGMVAAGFMDVRIAIPPIMGANIGTSITNTIVSFTQAGDRSQFRRAFAAATILDMFNWITVIVLLPIEVLFGYLYYVSKASVDLIIPDSQSGGEIKILSVITDPFVDLIVQLNDTVLECWATPNCTDADDASLVKVFCSTAKTEIIVRERVTDNNGKEIINRNDVTRQDDLQKCDFLFAGTSMSDAAVGSIILVSSLIVLCFCLVMIVKLLSSVLEGHVSTIIKRTLNADIPYVPWITGYIAIFIGAFMTFLVQSSSVFTSALTPLVGLGVISLNRVYPLTLGANIGTTTTAILASMAAEGKSLYPSLQIALCHFFFNITGVLLFYPVPFLRFPISMAKALGNTTAKYRWFAIFYLVSMFAVLPAIFILLSLGGSIYVIVLVAIAGITALLVLILTTLQRRLPKILPEPLRTWKFLPEPFRSLRPYDRIITKLSCCKNRNEDDNGSDDGETFPSVYQSSDFVFLTGNKIPPPGDVIIEGETKPRASITRIVPTRVIRNINNGELVEASNGNVGKETGTIPRPLSLTEEGEEPSDPSNSTDPSKGDSLLHNINTTLQSNTLPMPNFIGESLTNNLNGVAPLNNQIPPASDNGSSSNLAYNSTESFKL